LQQAFPCPKCGAQIPVGQYFCGNCGQNFVYRCRHCGTAIKSSSGFCPNCGTKLYQQTQATEPSATQFRVPPQEISAPQTPSTPNPAGQVGRYFILIAVIVLIGAILYAIGTGPQGETANWFGGSFIFGGQSPPSTPPTSDTQEEPKPDSDSPSYTADQVIAAAKRISPHCRLPTKRTG